MFIWICGVSGAGKTQLGRAVYGLMRPSRSNLFLLDGDEFRAAMGDSLGYAPHERIENAHRIARLCHLMDAQGLHVICCAVTLPKEVQALNRVKCERYVEVFLRVSRETLLRRDPKGLYRKCLKGEVSNLPGFDIDYLAPESPHLVFDNDDDRLSLDGFASDILQFARRDRQVTSRVPPEIHDKSWTAIA